MTRRLEAIGEVVLRLPADIRDKHPQIRWVGLVALRELLRGDDEQVEIDLSSRHLEDAIAELERQFLKISRNL